MSIRRLTWIAILTAATVLFLFFSVPRGHTRGVFPLSEKRNVTPPQLPAVTYLRRGYPYSVIPGGVYSKADLQRAVRAETVVAEHYSGFDVKNAKLVNADADLYRYVSYRLNGRVYWTGKKLRIPKGEALLSDGRNLARARCGNRLSEMPGTTDTREPSLALSLPSSNLDLAITLAPSEDAVSSPPAPNEVGVPDEPLMAGLTLPVPELPNLSLAPRWTLPALAVPLMTLGSLVPLLASTEGTKPPIEDLIPPTNPANPNGPILVPPTVSPVPEPDIFPFCAFGLMLLISGLALYRMANNRSQARGGGILPPP